MMQRIKPSDYHSFDGYKDNLVRDFFSLSLVNFAYSNFFKAKKIQKFEVLEEFVLSNDYLEEEKKNKFIEENKKILFNSLLDNIIISVSFENYFKAKLLQNGFLIHQIDKNKRKDLSKLQNKRPVLIKEIENTDCLKETTLNYSLLLINEEYSKFYNVDKTTLEFLQKLNRKRNGLHLYMSEKFELSKSEINNLGKLKSIIECDFALLNNSILDKSSLDKKSSRIPVKCK